MPRDRVHGGHYYGQTDAGRLVPLGDVEQAPDVVLCRRVADFPNGTPPPSAQLEPCRQCGATIAFNPIGPHRDRPRTCLQCGGIEPEPII